MKKYKYTILSIFALIVLISLSVIFFSNLKRNTNKDNIDKDKEIKKEEIKEPVIEETELSMIMVGDCLIHGAIYDDARNKQTGEYNFYKMIDLMKPIISKYDLAFYNQESILGGTSLGLSSYPRFNAPQEVGDAFIDAGFNMVSLANNNSLDKGEQGILSSLDYWKKKENVMTSGSYRSFEERDKDVIFEKNGITYSLLSYTTTTNGLNRPKGKEYLVNVYDKEQVKKDVERLRDKVDLLIVSMHWGEEYTHTPTNEQIEIANYLASLNVDIVVGHHPHVLQPIDFIGKTVIIYSLGNFIASQYGVEKLTGLMVSLTVNKTTTDGISTVSLSNVNAELSYVYSIKDSYRHSYRLYPYEELNDKLLSGYKTYYDKFMSIVTSKSDKISYKPI